jgi:glutamate 5-kinase
VIKVGSSLLCSDEDSLDFKIFRDLAAQVVSLVKAGKEVLIVSSGAIALGMHKLGLKERPKELYNLQAAAAVGQHELMNTYRRFFRGIFAKDEIHGAQVLLTWEDFNDRRRYLNAKNTLFALLKYGTVPIINENDTVSTDEIKFGDNDQLSARVASIVSADILIILSDVDGLLDKDKTLVRVVEKITPQIKALACPTHKKTCVGGMLTKIEAAKIAIDSGIPCVIANGRKKDIILAVLKEPEKQGTLFLPRKGLAEKERWIAFGTKPRGKIMVDEGAKNALLNKKSLLSVGVIGIEGTFECGDVVSLTDKHCLEFARGKVRVSSKHLDKVKGKRSDKEVIHCDNIVILS